MIYLGNQNGLTSPEVIQATQQLDCLLNKLWHEENRLTFNGGRDLQVKPSLYQSKGWFFSKDIDQVRRIVIKNKKRI